MYHQGCSSSSSASVGLFIDTVNSARAAAAPAPRDDAGSHGGLERALLLAVVVACVKINPLSHFSATTWPRWLRRAVRNRHLHVNLIFTQLGAVVRILIRVDFF